MRIPILYSIVKSELKALFTSSTVYIFLIIFLLLHSFFAFRISNFFATGEASMENAFMWHPWLYLILVPAIGMHLWADERREGTLELLFTFPLTIFEMVLGKFIASAAVLGGALLSTFPLVFTLYYLGNPDLGPLICGYAGSFLNALLFLAISCWTSSLTRSHVTGFILALFFSLFLNLAGFPPVIDYLRSLQVESNLVDWVASLSVISHFNGMQRGFLELTDVVYFISVTLFFLLLTVLSLESYGRKKIVCWGISFIYFLALVGINILSVMLPAHWDFTENKAYSLLEDTVQILNKISPQTPLTMTFYFSNNEELSPQMKGFARRLHYFFKRYADSNPNIQFVKMTPLPDTEAEDLALANGLAPQKLKNGENFYLGLTIRSFDKIEILPFISIHDEPLLEYRLAGIITQLINPEKYPITILAQETSLSNQQYEHWFVFNELKKRASLSFKSPMQPDLQLDPVETPLLILCYPLKWPDSTLAAIDQYILKGGKLLVFLDALPYVEMPSNSTFFNLPKPSQFEPFLSSWGIQQTLSPIVDLNAAPRDSKSHLFFYHILKLTTSHFNQNDSLCNGLKEISLFSPCGFRHVKKSNLTLTPLLQTSDQGAEIAAELVTKNIPQSADVITAPLQSYLLGVRLNGFFNSAYPDGDPCQIPFMKVPESSKKWKLKAEKESTVILLSDLDFICDQAIFQTDHSGFGTYPKMINDNAFFFLNIVDSLLNRTELTRIRMKPVSHRPLVKIKEMEREVALQSQSEINQFEMQLQKIINEKLRLESKNSWSDHKQNVITPAMEQQIKDLEQKRVQVKQALKKCRRQLHYDIESLQLYLEVLNFALMPLFFSILGSFIIFYRIRRSGKS